MYSSSEILDRIQRSGATVSSVDGHLRIRHVSKLPPDLLPEIRARKDALLDLLRDPKPPGSGKGRDPLPADFRRWESGPRYVLALLERRGRSRADAVELVRRWWLIGPTVENLTALGIENAGRILEDAGMRFEKGD